MAQSPSESTCIRTQEVVIYNFAQVNNERVTGETLCANFTGMSGERLNGETP